MILDGSTGLSESEAERARVGVAVVVSITGVAETAGTVLVLVVPLPVGESAVACCDLPWEVVVVWYVMNGGVCGVEKLGILG